MAIPKNTTIRLRRGTSANLTSMKPVPADGEPVYSTDEKVLKIGDGVNPFNKLPIAMSAGD